MGAVEPVSGFSRLGRTLGVRIAGMESAYHRSRLPDLTQSGSSTSAADSWAQGDPPPRRGNHVDVLIDGEQMLPRVAAAIAGARSHVFMAGWFFTPEMVLAHEGQPIVLRELLSGVADRVDVRILMWAGAPLPLFHPWRRDVRRVHDRLCSGGIHCALDKRERPMHTHHEKLLVVDDQVAFVGGFDLTDLDGDRYDTTEHELRAGVGWHDVGVELRGPIVADVAAHMKLRWFEVTGERLTASEPSSPSGPLEAQLVATMPAGMYRSRPAGELRILEVYLRALRSAQRLIYLENQFLWSPEIVAILRDKLLDPPSESFRLIMVLPTQPNNGASVTLGQLGVLAEADPEGRRFLACGICAREGTQSMPVYVHSKVGIVDDHWLTIGSANLNEGSLFHDTEVNVVLDDHECAELARRRLWSEHLELPIEAVDGSPSQLFDEVWKPIAEEQLERRDAGLPPTHRLRRLPYVPSRWALVGPLTGVLIDA